MYVASPRLLACFALAILGVLAPTCHVASKEIIPNHAREPPLQGSFRRGGKPLSAEKVYTMLNKWVVHLRKPDLPAIKPNTPLNYKHRFDGDYWGYMALGYGLYFREPGFMIANLRNIMTGSKLTDKERRVLEGHYVHYKEKEHYAPLENASSPILYLPHTLTDIKHVFTFANTDFGVFRVSMNGFKEEFKPANGKPPYERHIDYPGANFMPDIAKPEDIFYHCYAIMHNHLVGDRMGYNEYQWRYFPIFEYNCTGAICDMDTTKRLTASWLELEEAGYICRSKQDTGAPIFCSTDSKNWEKQKGDTANRFKGDWKLKYMVARANANPGECNTSFYALDLSKWRSTLFDPGWLQFLEGGIW